MNADEKWCNDFVISTMTWSFTRLESFYQCPYGWKKHYIDSEQSEGNAFADYGTIAHRLLEEYAKGEVGAFDLAPLFKKRFDEEIIHDFPYNQYSDMRQSYFEKGYRYFSEFTDLFDEEVEILGVEKKVEFDIDGYPFIGFIDLLARDKNGSIIVHDHKSASLKLKTNGQPTKAFEKKLLMYKRQLYLYCKALIDEGIHPEYLQWNFFNDQKVYRVPFVWEEYTEAIQWAADTIKLIEKEAEFAPNEEYYFCHNLCDMRMCCEYCDCNKEETETETEEEAFEPKGF